MQLSNALQKLESILLLHHQRQPEHCSRAGPLFGRLQASPSCYGSERPRTFGRRTRLVPMTCTHTARNWRGLDGSTLPWQTLRGCFSVAFEMPALHRLRWRTKTCTQDLCTDSLRWYARYSLAVAVTNSHRAQLQDNAERRISLARLPRLLHARTIPHCQSL